MTVTILALLFLGGFALLIILDNKRTRKNINKISFIENFQYPQKLRDALLSKYPHLAEDELEDIVDGLKQYFISCSLSRGRLVSMPSQAVDEAWHEFILFTELYQEFCQNSFGKFLHHTPAEAMEAPKVAQDGIKTAWQLACSLEGIDSKKPAKLPLLFSIDRDLKIPNGYIYKLNCNPEKMEYCAGDIDTNGERFGSSCSSGCGGD